MRLGRCLGCDREGAAPLWPADPFCPRCLADPRNPLGLALARAIVHQSVAGRPMTPEEARRAPRLLDDLDRGDRRDAEAVGAFLAGRMP